MESENFYESLFDVEKLSPQERLLFYELRDERSWEEWNDKQKKIKMKQFAKAILRIFTENTDDAENLLAEFLKLKMKEINWVKSLFRLATTKANELQTELDQANLSKISTYKIDINAEKLKELLEQTITLNKIR